MSKKLDSILARVPPATVNNVAIAPATQTEQLKEFKEIQPIERSSLEKTERIVAVIPAYLKREMKLYLADHPGENERTLILRGLKAIGFKILDEELSDKRGRLS